MEQVQPVDATVAASHQLARRAPSRVADEACAQRGRVVGSPSGLGVKSLHYQRLVITRIRWLPREHPLRGLRELLRRESGPYIVLYCPDGAAFLTGRQLSDRQRQPSRSKI